jgi:chromosome segregation ATPase
LERELKQLQERWELTNKSKLTEQGGLEKRVDKLLEEKDRLQLELEQTKAERDQKMIDHQKQLDKEREAYK